MVRRRPTQTRRAADQRHVQLLFKPFIQVLIPLCNDIVQLFLVLSSQSELCPEVLAFLHLRVPNCEWWLTTGGYLGVLEILDS